MIAIHVQRIHAQRLDVRMTPSIVTITSIAQTILVLEANVKTHPTTGSAMIAIPVPSILVLKDLATTTPNLALTA